MAGTSKMPGNIRDKAEGAAASASQAASDVTSLAKEAASTAAQKASDVASNLGQKASDVASNLGQKAQDMTATAVGKTDDAISSVGEGISSLAGTIRQNAPQGMLGSAAGTVADRLEAGGQYLQGHGVREMGDDLSSLVRQYPIQSLLAVFGVGFLLGSSMRR